MCDHRRHHAVADDRLIDPGRRMGETVILRIKVKPGARASELTSEPDGSWRARLRSPPVDGKANTELVALVAEHFRCPKSAVTIKSGLSGRSKIARVDLP